MDCTILTNFYRCTIESILTGGITTWFGNSTAQDRKTLQRVVKSAQRITRTALPSIQDLYSQRCRRKAKRIISDPSHPCHSLFSLLPSGRRYKSIRSRTSRYRDSFYPHAIRMLNCPWNIFLHYNLFLFFLPFFSILQYLFIYLCWILHSPFIYSLSWTDTEHKEFHYW